MQVMQDKARERGAQNAALRAAQPQPAAETVEERKARLAAQRDLLRRMKEEKRQKELNEFNSKFDFNPAAENNLADELRQLDANKKNPVAKPQINNLTGGAGNMSEMDRRRMIYKNVRKDISEQDAAAK